MFFLLLAVLTAPANFNVEKPKCHEIVLKVVKISSEIFFKSPCGKKLMFQVVKNIKSPYWRKYFINLYFLKKIPNESLRKVIVNVVNKEMEIGSKKNF